MTAASRSAILNTLRAADPSVNLAAQHALAREYGFESWPKLVHPR